MINDQDAINISQDVGLVYIAVNVKLGNDPHVRVGWGQVVTHMSHTFRLMLVVIHSSTIQAI